MLILKADRVRFCKAMRRIAGEVACVEALEYRGLLFASGETFEKSQRKEALQRVREVLDAPQDTVPALVELAGGYTLWYQDESIVEMTEADWADAARAEEFQPDEEKAGNVMGQLFPTFQSIANRLRSGQSAPREAVLAGERQG